MNRESPRVSQSSPCSTEAVSFCVVSTSGKLDRVRRLVTSIQQQSLPVREIIVCGDVPGGLDDTVIRLSCIRAAEENRVGELRNRACQRASGDIIVVCDDNTVLRKSFVEEILKAGPIELLVPRIENPDGTRYWDWATFGGPKGHALLNYNETDPYAYVDGCVYIINRKVAQRVLWEELQPIGIPQSVDFSRRILTSGYQIKLCRSAVAIREDDRFTQTEDFVRRIHLTSSFEDIGDGILGRGIYDLEQDGSRLISPIADIEVPADLLEKPSLLSFTLQAHASELYNTWPLTCEVAVNGEPTLQLEFKTSVETKEIVLPLSASATKILLSFRSDSCVVPRVSLNHRDTRVFSLFLSHLTLEKKCSLYTTSKLIEGSQQAQSAFASLPVGVHFVGPILDNSYWGAESRALLEQFESQELPLSVDCSKTNLAFIRGIAHNKQDKDLWHRRFSRQLRGGTLIIFTDTEHAKSPEFFSRQLRLHPYFGKNIIWSFASEVTLDDSWENMIEGYDELWVTSHYQRSLFSELGRIAQHKIKVMPAGIDTNFYNPASVSPLPLAFNRGFTFLSDLSISDNSGWRELLEAYFSVFTRGDDVCLILRIREAADSNGSESDLIRSFIKGRGYDHPTSPPIFFLDTTLPHTQIPSLYAVANVFVSPAAVDTPPEDILRAMSMRLPVITTRQGSAIEIVNDDVGWLVGCRAQDSVSEFETSPHTQPPSWQHLAQIMRQAFEDQNRSFEKGQNARELVLKRHKVGEVVDWIERSISADLGRSPRRTSVVLNSLASRVEKSVSDPGTSPLRQLQFASPLEKRRSQGGKLVAIDTRPLLYPQLATKEVGHFTENHLRTVAEMAPEWEFHYLFHSLETTPQIERMIAAPNVKRIRYESACMEKYDIFHITDPFCVFPDCDSPFRVKPDATITSALVHNLAPLSLPDSTLHTWDTPTQNAYLARVDQLKSSFVHLFSPSVFMALEAGRHLNIPHDRNSIIYSGPHLPAADSATLTAQERDRILDRLGVSAPFFLFTGSLDAHGNFGTALLALGRARSLADVRLVVTVSPYDPLAQFYQDLCHRQNIEGVLFVGDLSEHDLSALYYSAVAVLSPSLYLSSGGVILDALSRGCPVLGCNAGAIPEVVDQAGLLVAPQDIATYAQYMLKILRDDALKLSLEEKAYEQSQKYSWRRTAQLTLKTWNDLLAGRELQSGLTVGNSQEYINNYLPSTSQKIPNAFLKAGDFNN